MMLTPPGKPTVTDVPAVVPVLLPEVEPDARVPLVARAEPLSVLSALSVFEAARDVGAGVSLTESMAEGAGVAETEVASGEICLVEPSWKRCRRMSYHYYCYCC